MAAIHTNWKIMYMVGHTHLNICIETLCLPIHETLSLTLLEFCVFRHGYFSHKDERKNN